MIRGVGLRGAVAVNVAAMIGAGPLITIPLVVAAMHGSVSVAAWIAGALIALCDGLVYAELAARLPRTGGTYAYLREAFGSSGLGRLIAFLYVWQLCFSMPLLLASGYIGFAQYAGFLVPALAADPLWQKWTAVGIGAITLVALCRAIPAIARTAIVLATIALATLATVAFAGLTHPVHPLGPILAHALDPVGVGALGAALVITAYDYAGYGDITQMGEEVIAPQRTMPLAVLWSVAFVAIAYLALNVGVFATLAPDAVAHATSVASDVVDRTLGRPAAIAVTVGVLITAFASTYGALLGAARVPFAAARDGDFLAFFARLHPTAKFPVASLVVLGLLALPACFLSLGDVINALTAASVLVGSVGQIVGLALLRRRTPDAPFRIPLYPLPPLIALGAWIYLFIATGTNAMLFGTATLALGAVVFLVRARIGRMWPFVAASAAALALLIGTNRPASAESFTHAAVVLRDGNPTLVVDGKPFFFYGTAFFYERMQPEMWAASMRTLRDMGFNTLDLYVPWNWHETSDGDVDFDGHSDPRRNLRDVLRLADAFGFKLIIRPGPVIRNEWRNGGYPAWLLTRPEYGMPLHDILEGRYPATATLQNEHSDAAAAQWLANTTHLSYAHRWLTTVLREVEPVADRVIAIQLDDDQGAYLDNDTWPAPHLHAYLGWLEKTVREVTGPQIPVFINTYEMRVTASSPVWAMGNWYQSDAYSIGEHDRSILEFSTGLLQTQRSFPVAISEFQAGWLAQPEDPEPRPADPTNTTLALHTLLGLGARGIIIFPAQDTIAPAGWEAPFANETYAWGAALTIDVRSSDRYGPTKLFGEDVHLFGPELARSRRLADGAIAYLTSSFDPTRVTQADVFAIAARTQSALRACRLRGLTCDLVDLSFISFDDLKQYRFLVLPLTKTASELTAATRSLIDRYRSNAGIVGAEPPAVVPRSPFLDGTLLQTADGATFLDIVNFDAKPRIIPTRHIVIGTTTFTTPHLTVRARGAQLLRLDTQSVAPDDPVMDGPRGLPETTMVDSGRLPVKASVRTDHDDVALENDVVQMTFRPNAGGRAFSFSLRNAPAALDHLTSVGAMRDDAAIQPPLSTTDLIGKYTRSFPAGMFNRPYAVTSGPLPNAGAFLELRYHAPDVLPAGGSFERRIEMAANEPRVTARERATFDGDIAGTQRAVRYDSFAMHDAQIIDERVRGAIGVWSGSGGLLVVSWPAGDVEAADLIPERTSEVLKLRFAPADRQARTTVYAIAAAKTLDEATAIVTADAGRTQQFP
jgi:amino acid transporter